MERGTGKTTEQIKNAPKNAVFVWCNSHLDYPKDLAIFLERPDLKIVSPNYDLRGTRNIIYDHAGIKQ